MCDDKVSPLVIDHGSGFCKVGFAGNDAPTSVFPSLVGHPENKEQGVRDSYIGNEAESNRSILNLSLNYPIKHGVITDYDDIEQIWDYMFHKELKVDPKQHAILIAEPTLCPTIMSEKLTEILFEKYKFPALYLANQGSLSLYSCGRTTGIVLDCGAGLTQIVPVSKAIAMRDNSLRANFAGFNLTDYLMKMLKEEGFYIADREVVCNMKEKCCFVAYDSDLNFAAKTNSSIMRYRLPDKNFITVPLAVRFKCPEVLFQPLSCSVVPPDGGIQHSLYNCIMKFDPQLQKSMYENIVLAGGTTLFPGFAQRLENEIKALAPASMNVNIIASSDRKDSAWIGGSIAASLSSFEQMSMSKAEYEEHGPAYIHRKKNLDSCNLSLTQHETQVEEEKIEGSVGILKFFSHLDYVEKSSGSKSEKGIQREGVLQFQECQAECDYPALDDEELNLKAGDIITNVVQKTNGWCEGTLKGKRGIFPEIFVKVLKLNSLTHIQTSEKNPIRTPSTRRVLFAFSPSNEEELRLEVGDIVEFVTEIEDGWCKGRANGHVGIFPSNFVSDYEPTSNEISESLGSLKMWLEKAKQGFSSHPQLINEILGEWKCMKRKLSRNEDLLITYGHLFNETSEQQISAELNDIKTLWKDVKEMKRNYQVPAPKTICPICQDEEVDFLLNCGHPYCENCAKECKTCPICREDITKMTKIYWSM